MGEKKLEFSSLSFMTLLLGCEMWSVLYVTVSEQWKLVMRMDTGKGNELQLTSFGHFGVTCPGLRTVKVDIF